MLYCGNIIMNYQCSNIKGADQLVENCSIHLLLCTLYDTILNRTSLYRYLRFKDKVPSVNKGHIPVNTVEEIAYTRKKRLFDVTSQSKLC